MISRLFKTQPTYPRHRRPVHRARVWPLFAALVACAAHADSGSATATTLPLENLYGAYELIGRGPGPSQAIYHGWVRLAVEGETIEVDRCVEGIHTTGKGRVITLPPNQQAAIEFHFAQRDTPLKAACAVTSDFDNLPRFTCHTTPPGKDNITTPGLETYFAIVWPVALDYFACR